MESEEEYNKDRKNLLKIVVDTGDDYPEYDYSSEDSSISSIDSSSNDMDVDEVSENPEDIEVQNIIFYDRQNFIDIFKDKHSCPNAIVLQTQKFYHLKWQKYMLCMSIILYIENFLKIKENQDHHLKIKLKLYWFSWRRTWIKFKFNE